MQLAEKPMDRLGKLKSDIMDDMQGKPQPLSSHAVCLSPLSHRGEAAKKIEWVASTQKHYEDGFQGNSAMWNVQNWEASDVTFLGIYIV